MFQFIYHQVKIKTDINKAISVAITSRLVTESVFKKFKNFQYNSVDNVSLNKNYPLKSRKNLHITMNSSNYPPEKISKDQDISGDGGIIKNILKEGDGLGIKDGFQVKLNYQGQLSDGRIFDSSLTRKKPFSFKIGEGKVIKGWEIGIKSMKVGEKAKFFISSRYGYKKKGIPPIIPPNADLFFEIEIIEAYPPATFSGVTDSVNEEELPVKISKNMELQSNSKQNSPLDKFFFISPFSSQTGEKAPWWLNPNITFFLIFILILVLFGVVYSLGGINQSFDNPSSILNSED